VEKQTLTESRYGDLPSKFREFAFCLSFKYLLVSPYSCLSFLIARCFVKEKKYNKAINHLQNLSKHQPNSPEPHALIALILANQNFVGDRAKILNLLKKVGLYKRLNFPDTIWISLIQNSLFVVKRQRNSLSRILNMFF